ncbi:MAG: DUF1287 domain-containing protein, partial [Actinomycetota bacterium]
ITVIPIKSVRIVLGLLFVLFLPGYIFIASLFPKKKDLGSIERLALSFGLSIAIVPLIGLILNYTPWGIRLYPILFSISAFILICSIITWYRRNKISEDKRFLISFEFDFPKWKAIGKLDKFLSIILIISIISAIGMLIYVIAKPKIGERFTEFYILGPGGMADNYPTELTIGETGKVIVGIINREYENVNYDVIINMGGEEINRLSSISLAHDEKWEKRVNIVPEEIGENIKVEFLLYKGEGENIEPYRELHLWIDVHGLEIVQQKEEISKENEEVSEISSKEEEIKLTETQIKILESAKNQVQQNILHTERSLGFFEGGYPPESEGTSVDVIVRALLYAGYDLKKLIHEDMLERKEDYPLYIVYGQEPNENIDFRRTYNQEVFFKKYATTLTNDLIPEDEDNLSNWQPGDIVFFDLRGDKWSETLAIVSDKLNEENIPYVIMSSEDLGKVSEVDMLREWKDYICGHYRYPKH